jgi:hypothetical protein
MTLDDFMETKKKEELDHFVETKKKEEIKAIPGFECELCGFKAKTERGLKQHKNIHRPMRGCEFKYIKFIHRIPEEGEAYELPGCKHPDTKDHWCLADKRQCPKNEVQQVEKMANKKEIV